METRISSATKEVVISYELPTRLIGERINPTGKKKLAAALEAGDLEMVRREALAQVEAGADILDINVGTPAVDEVALLPEVVQLVMETVDVPLCIDSSNPKALEAALKVYKGKALINSVSGEERSLEEILPLIKEAGAAVVGLTMGDEGIPQSADQRVAVAYKIMDRAAALGIPAEDVIIDCLALTLGADTSAGMITVETIRRIRAELGVNITLGASNVSFGLPDRNLLTSAFLSVVIFAGV
ncbi:MAG: dihydropteroate synthase, partial [Anaerolineae bacterium]|nr:dihydropteroate synthase [Anaerolineae bacterium]